MYFIEKEAVYSHGIWWHGDSIAKGLIALAEIAEKDYDDHHAYVLK